MYVIKYYIINPYVPSLYKLRVNPLGPLWVPLLTAYIHIEKLHMIYKCGSQHSWKRTLLIIHEVGRLDPTFDSHFTFDML